MAQHVKVNPNTDEMLSALSVKRKAEHAAVRTKQDIIAELVAGLYKKEVPICKK